MIVTLSGDVPERTLFQHARALQDQIEGSVSTVLQAELVGHREELLEVIIDPSRMESYDVSQSELINAVSLNNRLVAAGAVNSGEGRFSVKVPGLFEDRDDVLNLPVKVSGDGVVTLSDLADIRRTFKDVDSFARFNGQPAIALEITKRIGENIVDNNQQVIEVVERFSENWPDEIQVNYTLDASTWIFRALGSLQASIITAIALVMIVCVAALGMRSSILVGVAIPTSFMIGFLFMSIMGMTVNMMVMFGMLLSVGILVDGAIVVTEYGDRKMSEGESPKKSYGMAAKRMAWPISTSTATTLAAFLPLMFWPVVVGEFMKFLPLTLIATLSASLMMALIFVPTLGASVSRSAGGSADPEIARQLAGAEDGNLTQVGGFTGGYLRVLDRALSHPGKILCAAVGLLIGVQVVYGQFGTGIDFFPEVAPVRAIIQVRARGHVAALDNDLWMRP